MLLKKVFTPFQKIDAFFRASNQNKEFLVFFRIGVSFIALIEFTSFLEDLSFFFSPSGTIIPQELMYLQSSYFKYLQPFYNFLESSGLFTSFFTAVTIAYILFLFLLLIGFWTRYVAILTLLLQLLIYKSFANFNYGYNYFMTMSLFYCVLFPVAKFFSADRIFFKFWKCKSMNINYQRILQIHLGIAYFFSGIAKALDPGWWNGNSMWKALASIDNSYYAIPETILIAVGIGTVLLEFFYPLLMFYRKTRFYTLIAIIFMHSGIAIMMDLYAFSALMITWNIAAFGNLKSVKKPINAKLA